MTFLSSISFNLRYGEPDYTRFYKRFSYLLQFERLDYCANKLHRTYKLADTEKTNASSSAPYPSSEKSEYVNAQSYDPHENP